MDSLNKIVKKHGIEFIALFGFFVNKRKELNDIDITLIFNKEKQISIEEYTELTHFFSASKRRF